MSASTSRITLEQAHLVDQRDCMESVHLSYLVQTTQIIEHDEKYSSLDGSDSRLM